MNPPECHWMFCRQHCIMDYALWIMDRAVSSPVSTAPINGYEKAEWVHRRFGLLSVLTPLKDYLELRM